MAWDRSSQSPRVGVRGQVTNHSLLHSHVTTCSPVIGPGRGRGLVAVPPRAGAQQGEAGELHQHLRQQVSCDWWISGHVTRW